MRTILAMSLFVAWTTSTLAQVSEAPRVTGEEDAAGATIIINEISTGQYPDVLILATVLQDGEPLTGLTAADFRVREDEVDQEPLTVEPQLPPLSVVVTLDTSGSMARRMAETQEAAKQFVDSLDERDSVQLLRFARDIETLTPMTSNKASVRDAIDTVVARGDTALYDALHESIDLLADRPGRRAVVLLSDGVDDDGAGQPLSERTVDEVLAHAGTVGVPVFVIGLGTEMDEAILSHIADSTGAQYLNAPEASELAAVYGQISDQLTGQYAIRYTSNLPADGIQRRVDLSALRAQDSRTYAPEADPNAEPPTATTVTGSCAPSVAMEAEMPELQQASERHNQGLIGVTDRNDVRRESMGRIEQAVADATADLADLACVRVALETTQALYDGDMIAINDRDRLRTQLTTPILDQTCGHETSVDGLVACLAFLRDAHNDDIISVSTRNSLRAETFDHLTDLYEENLATDDALLQLNGLYEEDLISINDRNKARDRFLQAEAQN